MDNLALAIFETVMIVFHSVQELKAASGFFRRYDNVACYVQSHWTENTEKIDRRRTVYIFLMETVHFLSALFLTHSLF